jgi:hypothetical protein
MRKYTKSAVWVRDGAAVELDGCTDSKQTSGGRRRTWQCADSHQSIMSENMEDGVCARRC